MNCPRHFHDCEDVLKFSNMFFLSRMVQDTFGMLPGALAETLVKIGRPWMAT